MASKQEELRAMMASLKEKRNSKKPLPKKVIKRKAPEPTPQKPTPTPAHTSTTQSVPAPNTASPKPLAPVKVLEEPEEEVAVEKPVIPAGFFDDEKKDRKARKVDVASNAELMKKEMKEFEKSIQGELQTFDQELAEEDEESIERQLAIERREQMQLLGRVQQLRARRAKTKAVDLEDTAQSDPEEADADALPRIDPKQLKHMIKEKREAGAKVEEVFEDVDVALTNWRAKSIGTE